MEPGIGDFFSQVPPVFIVMPIVFGLLYAGVMVLVFRRAAARRRRQRGELTTPLRPAAQAQYQPAAVTSAADKLSNKMPPPIRTTVVPASSATNPDLPEPDLDLLMGSLLDQAEAMASVPLPVPPPAAPPIAPPAAPAPDSLPVADFAIDNEAAPADEASMGEILSALPVDAVEVLRIWRDVSDGGLLLQIGTNYYRAVSDIQSQDQLRRLGAVMRELGLITGELSLATASEANATVLSEDAIEVMCLWRDLTEGTLIIQMGTQASTTYYTSPRAIQSADQVRRYQAITRSLAALVGGAASAPASTARTTGAMPVSNPLPNPLPIAYPTGQPPIVNTYAPPTPIATKPEGPRGAGGILARISGRNTPQEPQAPLGIGASVEQYLQNKLMLVPTLAGRSIHIRPSPDHGVKIEVDGQFFDAVDEVTDVEVQAFLTQVMQEWSERH